MQLTLCDLFFNACRFQNLAATRAVVSPIRWGRRSLQAVTLLSTEEIDLSLSISKAPPPLELSFRPPDGEGDHSKQSRSSAQKKSTSVCRFQEHNGRH